jgi:alkylhydroperoxidase/carboxymuconolactone decarboxylase family protein YurZ
MAPNERARQNHDELFPGHVSTLAVTDPELIETFDNFAFDEVLRQGNLDARTRLMVQLASMIASQALREYRVMLGAALNVGVTPVEAKEIVYQAVPYVGMAKVFDFIHATNDVLTERGVALPLPGQSTTTPENRAEKGLTVQKQMSGAMSSRTYTPPRPTISCTSSVTFRPTASATTTLAPASMCLHASFSPSACSSHSVDAKRRSRAMSPRTSTSATTAHG